MSRIVVRRTRRSLEIGQLTRTHFLFQRRKQYSPALFFTIVPNPQPMIAQVTPGVVLISEELEGPVTERLDVHHSFRCHWSVLLATPTGQTLRRSLFQRAGVSGDGRD